MSNPLGPRPSPDGTFSPHADDVLVALGDRLLADGLIDDLALRRAERARQQSGERLDHVLARLGLVSEDALVAVLAELLGMQTARADDLPRAALLTDRVDPGFLQAKRMLPLEEEADRLVVAVADPFDTAACEALAFHVEKAVERRLATAPDIEQALARLYGAGPTLSARVDAASGIATASDEDVRRLEDLASEAPVIRLVQDLISRAVEQRASDIHIEPRQDCVRVRYRIDGVLHTIEKLPVDVGPAVASRVKILSRLDIAERRIPQDGRTKSVVRGRELDMRVSTVPTIHGESCVLRILDRSAVALDLSRLGFDEPLVRGLRGLLRRPHGIVLVTGPTGSGKTTTLYSALATLDAEASKIFTVEDPIEYRLPEINQLQVQPRIGLTFATALRAILRQDPDIIMVGEIRDLETAQIAIQASLTGHLVLSTVHTNSAAATVTRLLDMGIESYLLASSLTGVLAQRLVRRLCADCSVESEADPSLVESMLGQAGPAIRADGPKRVVLRSAVGCASCRGTGYDGRIAIGELMKLDGELSDLIRSGGSDLDIGRAATAAGMSTLHQAGLAKALAGETTLEEVLRVTRLEA